MVRGVNKVILLGNAGKDLVPGADAVDDGLLRRISEC